MQTLQNVELIDLETSNGYNPINLIDLRKLIQFFPYGSKYRIWILIQIFSACRPAEPEKMYWDNISNNMLIYRNFKAEKLRKKKPPARKIKIPPLCYEELMYYKNNNFFENGKMFNFSQNTFRRKIQAIREKLGYNWTKLDPNIRCGKIAQYNYYTLRSIRTTIATLVFYYFKQCYGDNMALSRTCSWLGHGSEKITADHYIKHLTKIGLEKMPRLSFLNLIDYIIYSDYQTTLFNFEERQTLLIEN